jgi:hypothetical protein
MFSNDIRLQQLPVTYTLMFLCTDVSPSPPPNATATIVLGVGALHIPGVPQKPHAHSLLH